MKTLILLLLTLLTSCVPVAVETSAPEIVYVVVTATPEARTYLTNPEFYFASWEVSKEKLGATGMYFKLGEGEYLIFAEGEAPALHEVGHIRYDREDTTGFEEAVIEYLREYTEEQPYWRVNHLYEQGDLEEIYAELYVWNVLYELPREFIDFY